MNCPKCKGSVPDEYPWMKFCGQCGSPVREQCPKCGEWESIGRTVCETKLAEAKRKLNDFVKANYQKYCPWWVNHNNGLQISLLMAFALFAVSFPLSSLKFLYSQMEEKPLVPSAILCIALGLVLCVFLFFRIVQFGEKSIDKEREAKEKATEDFYQQFPNEAEILKKAKGDEHQ